VTLAIGDYRVIELLGQGASTHTVRVEDAAGTVMGVGKRLVPRLRDDPAARSQLDAEARVLEALAGRGAPRLIARGEDEQGPWLVMEHLAMPTLAARSSPPHDDRAALVARVAGCAFGALAAIHEAADARGPLAVVHGDISPENLLVDGRAGDARLIDFGLAHFRDMPPRPAASLRGTARYLAPEVARGEHATALSDLFSLGLTLLHAASGEPPRPGDELAWVLVQAGEEPVTAYAERAARDLPPRLRGALLAAVAFEPGGRRALLPGPG
jgi:serine/threonine protein kinase